MITALDSLRAEHETILAVVGRLEAAARAAGDGRLSHDYVRAALDFIRIYVDENHHGKEERVLFPAMSADAMLTGFADALSCDHEEGLDIVGALEAADLDDRPTTGYILAYAAFIRDHIRRENEMVFDAVENSLDDSALTELYVGFLQVEDEVLGPNGASRLLERLDEAYSAAGVAGR